MSISIIIPVLNEEQAIGSCLDNLSEYPDLEILVVDGGSSDQTLQQITARGLLALSSAPGRGKQQQIGAQSAAGDILLFLHCDTSLPHNFAVHVRKTLEQKGVVAGAFQLSINAQGWGYRIIEYGVKLRSRIVQLPYGDQALFMKRETYLATKGFPEQPIMEELVLLSRLKKLGRIAIAPACASTSARRWQQHGIMKTTIINQMMLLARAMGISPQRLASWYYKKS